MTSKLFKGKPRDSEGSPVSVVKMDPVSAYVGVPGLLQAYINDGDEAAWAEIRRKIDYIYSNVDKMLNSLSETSDYLDKIRRELEKHKILLFKPNLVNPHCIDPNTHGQATAHSACTEWPYIAALMRWFHDNLKITYGQMALGEAASVSSMTASIYNHTHHPRNPITTEAVFEGKSGDFYGGWGFYFVRKYLHDSNNDPEDDSYRGYEESTSGKYLPPGQARGRLMVYDLNKLNDVKGKTRTIPVPDGVNYSQITLPKVIVGGDPEDQRDRADYPGAVVVNVPRLKLHGIDLLTNAIKNLGIGLYPMEIGETEDINDTHWKYSYPYTEIPGMKTEIPHSVWVPDFEESTGLPLKDRNGRYRLRKTGGISATQIDVIKAAQSQGVYFLHIIDAIQAVNINHTGDPSAKKVSEGLILASEDPVAVDHLCARYCFKNIPREEAAKANLPTDFLQKVPSPTIQDGNIVTGIGYDSPLLRYTLYEKAEKRGLGKRCYYVIGFNETSKQQLVSIDGHIGSFIEDGFMELMTTEFYYDQTNIIWGLQKTAFDYLRANDQLTGSNYYRSILEAYDENGDGQLDYDEMGRDAFWHTYLRLAAYCYHLRGCSELGALKSYFLLTAMWRYQEPEWNVGGHNFMKNFKIVTDFALAYALSKSPKRAPDPMNAGMNYGEGAWPSMGSVSKMSNMIRIFGQVYTTRISLNSLYGYAFQYADKKYNNGHYTGGKARDPDPESINRYLHDAIDASKALDFKVYVPIGLGKIGKSSPPNLEETSDPHKIFTAEFPNEIWQI
jgi:hypothetical protein